MIIGITHEQNLHDLKHGFLKDGGLLKFCESREWKDDEFKGIPIAKGTVSYKDLHGVSKGVREILQNDGVSVEHFD